MIHFRRILKAEWPTVPTHRPLNLAPRPATLDDLLQVGLSYAGEDDAYVYMSANAADNSLLPGEKIANTEAATLTERLARLPSGIGSLITGLKWLGEAT